MWRFSTLLLLFPLVYHRCIHELKDADLRVRIFHFVPVQVGLNTRINIYYGSAVTELSSASGTREPLHRFSLFNPAQMKVKVQELRCVKKN